MLILVHHGWWRRHWPTVAVLGICTVTATAVVSVYDEMTTASITARNRQTAAMMSSYDTQIATLNAARTATPQVAPDAAVKAVDTPRPTVAADSTAVSTCSSVSTAHNDPTRVDVIVNKSHCISPLNYAPADLVSIDGYLLSAKIAPSLRAMMTAATSAGAPFGLTSSYRSYTNQVTTYDHWVTTNGSTTMADTVSARPGYSEHQTGFAVDLDAGSCALECFAKTPQYTWLQDHAAEFGFIQRYYDGYQAVTGYSPEPWHYRFVGIDVAQAMKAKGIKTLEEYWGVSGGDYLR